MLMMMIMVTKLMSWSPLTDNSILLGCWFFLICIDGTEFKMIKWFKNYTNQLCQDVVFRLMKNERWISIFLLLDYYWHFQSLSSQPLSWLNTASSISVQIFFSGHVAYHVMCCFLVVFQLTRSSRHFTLAGSCLVSLLQSQIGSGRICGWYRIYVYVRGNAN